MKHAPVWLIWLLSVVPSFGQTDRLPIIDVHLHSRSLAALKAQGPNPITGTKPPGSVEEHMKQTLAIMDQYNIVLGIVSGGSRDLRALEGPTQFKKRAPDRIWAAPAFGKPVLGVEELRSLYKSGDLSAMGEITAQYEGLSPSDMSLEPYFALAESLDIPVGIHTGLSFPGITQMGFPEFRVSLGNPVLFEELLNRHPKLRVWLMHAGWPFLAETIGILNVYPQVYVDIAVINWIRPREEFYSYLKELVKSGFGNRIMFGSDQMSWPDAIGMAVESIQRADFLSEQEKRDILYNNAARFLKLTPDQITKHHQDLSK